MEKSFLILSVPMLTLINFLHVPSFIIGAHADINIACGTTYPFNDSIGNYWIGDDQFIQSGSIETVKNTTSQYSQLLSTVRYFSDSDGNTNCYTIPILNQTNEIDVVAFFLYGNYDNQAQPPSFKLQIDDSNWSDVETSDDLVAYGMTYLPKADNVRVCLTRNETAGFPFISAIQLSSEPPPLPPDPSTEAPPPNPSTDDNGNIIQRRTHPIPLGPRKASTKEILKVAATHTIRGFIYLVAILPGGTFITLVVSLIACIQTGKNVKKARKNSTSDAAGVADQKKSDAEDKSKDEV